MEGQPTFAELLTPYLDARDLKARGLATLVNTFFREHNQPEFAKLSHGSAQNWLGSANTGPMLPQALEHILQIAVALGLNRAQTTRLLYAAERPSIDQLAANLRPTRIGRRMLVAEERLQRLLAYWEHETPHNLPSPLTSFIGREADRIERAIELTESPHRLVTLIGSGGVGKTRLAIEVGRLLLDTFPEGVWLLRLDAVTSTEQVLPLIARRVGLPRANPALLPRRLEAWLRDRRILLVLDNLEHLPDIGPALVTLLAATGELRILATSRVALRVAGEATRRVRPFLPTGTDAASLRSDPALLLFADRARAVDPQFTLKDGTVAAVGRLAEQLDGLPLALELAAARLRDLSFAQIQQRFTRAIDLGAAGPTNLSPRQRTLRRAIAGSYELLTAPCQALLRQLALLPGGGTRATLAAMLNRPDDADLATDLDDLVDYHLAESGVGNDQSYRYTLLNTIREYAEEQLDEEEIAMAQARLIARYTALAAEGVSDLAGDSNQERWRRRIETERANIYAALAWALKHDPARGLGLASRLWPYWLLGRDEAEGRRWLAALVAATPAAPGIERARALHGLGYLELWHDQHRARTVLTEAYSLAEALDERDLMLGILPPLCFILVTAGDAQAVGRYLATWREWPQAGDDPRLTTLLLLVEGFRSARQNDLGQAQRLLGVALARSGEERLTFFECMIRVRLGAIQLMRNQTDEARKTFAALLETAAAIGATRYEILAHYRLGTVEESRGDFAAAAQRYSTAFALAEEANDEFGRAHAQVGLGRLALRRGETDEAIALLDMALVQAQRHNDPLSTGEVMHWHWLALWRGGRRGAAIAAAQDCLRLVCGSSYQRGQVELLTALAATAATEGEADRAAAWHGVAEAARRRLDLPLPPADRAFYAAPTGSRRAQGDDLAIVALDDALSDAEGWLADCAEREQIDRRGCSGGEGA